MQQHALKSLSVTRRCPAPLEMALRYCGPTQVLVQTPVVIALPVLCGEDIPKPVSGEY